MNRQEFIDKFVQLTFDSQNKVVRYVFEEVYQDFPDKNADGISDWQDEPDRHDVADTLWRMVSRMPECNTDDSVSKHLQQQMDKAEVEMVPEDAREFVLLKTSYQFRVSYALARRASEHKDVRTILDWGMFVERLRRYADREYDVYRKLVNNFGAEKVSEAIDEEGEGAF